MCKLRSRVTWLERSKVYAKQRRCSWNYPERRKSEKPLIDQPAKLQNKENITFLPLLKMSKLSFALE